ncbi:MAG TPA: tripartite tricarboxylate transporter substrate-binding protein [Alphaproteobacteria bacterium]
MNRRCVAAGALLALAVGLGPAAADDFYKGRTIEILVGFGPGGGYDAYARALARSFGAHIPGAPQVVVKNMPGAGSLRLVNYIASAAPRDGTTLGTFDQNLIIAPVVKPAEAGFDASKLGWIGSIAKGTSVCVAWHGAGLRSWDDLLTTTAVFGVTGYGDVRYTDTAIVRNMFGAKLKTVAGYPGTNDLRLAMERGEIAGSCGDSWTSLKSLAADLLKDRKLNVLVQFAVQKHPDLPDVPLIIDKAETAEQKDALTLLFAPQLAGRPYAAPPGVPQVRLEILRAAFAATMQDSAFVAFAERAQLDIDPVSGRDIETFVAEVYRSSQPVIAAARVAIE